MKYLIKFYTIIILTLILSFNSNADDKIKIGLVIPLTGENKDLGESVLKSVRLAVNDINDERIVIIPRDNKNDPDQTLKVSEELLLFVNNELLKDIEINSKEFWIKFDK